MELHAFSIARLHHAEAGQFIVRLLSDLKDHNLDLQKDPTINNYINSLQKQSDGFKIALQQMQVRLETEDIAALDLQRDHNFNTINAQIAVYRHSDEKEEMDAYKTARIIMKNYKKIDKLNYEAETMELENLMAEWAKPQHQFIIKILQLENHIGKLSKSIDAFNVKFNSRSKVTMLQEVFDTKVLRNEMTESYRKFANYVLSMAENDKGELYRDLMKAINNGRVYFADLLAKRNGGNDSKDDTPSGK